MFTIFNYGTFSIKGKGYATVLIEVRRSKGRALLRALCCVCSYFSFAWSSGCRCTDCEGGRGM